MSANLLSLTLGVVLGIVTNFAAWAILFHYFVPKIRFSPKLSKVRIRKTEEDRSGYRYRFKIENAGRRNIIDIELTARLSVKGLRTRSIWNTLYIPLSADGNTSYRIPRMLPAKKGKPGRRNIIFLHPNSAQILHHWTIFPEKIRNETRNKTIKLDELLQLGIEAKLDIQAYCYDSFSGTKKLFISQPYTAQDITEGPFDPKSLNVKQAKVEQSTIEEIEAEEY